MRYIRTITILSVAALLAVSWTACGAADAQQGESSEIARASDSDDGPSFIERVFEPQPEPVVVPAGTLLELRL